MPESYFIRRLAAFASLAALLGSSACGGSSKGADGPSGTSANGDVAWKDKTREQRLDWMGLMVFPKMKGAFNDFDQERFSKFACQTCHSEEMEMVDFKMPNTKIYALPHNNTLQSARDYDAKVTDFMAGTVVPKMAELLQMEPYNPETKSGFGCFNCHPSEPD
jgi:hypothetical protein